MGKLVAIVRDRDDAWELASVIDEEDYAEPEIALCQNVIDYFVDRGYGDICKYYPYLERSCEEPVGDVIENGRELWREMECDSNMWSSGTVVGSEIPEVPLFVEVAREEDILMYEYMPAYLREALELQQ